MAFVYNSHSGEDGRSQWSRYLQNNAYVKDVTGAVTRVEKSVDAGSQSAHEDALSIVVSQEAVQAALSGGFDRIGDGLDRLNDTLYYGLADVSATLDRGFAAVEEGLGRIHRTLEWGFEQVLDQFAVSHMLEANIAELLRIPDFQKERQYYIEQGFKHYANGLWEEALDNLLKAEERERTDYVVLHRIGMVYLYRSELLDVPKAREYFEQAGKYAAVESGEGAVRLANILGGAVEGGRLRAHVVPADVPRRLAAEAYFQAGISAYVMGAFGDAVSLSKKAFSLNPALLDAGFNQAKALVAAGNGTEAVSVLKPVIRRDRTYALKTTRDGDLASDNSILGLLEKLKEEAVGRARKEWKTLVAEFGELVSPPEDTEEELIRREKAITNESQNIWSLIERNTYLEALAALDRIASGAEERTKKLDDLRSFKTARRKAIDRARRELETFQQEDFRQWHYPKADDEDKIAKWMEIYEAALGENTRAQAEEIPNRILDLRGFVMQATMQCLYTLRGHIGSVNAVSYSPDGDSLASGGADRTVLIWEMASERFEHTFTGHKDDVYTISYSPDGKHIASGSRDNTVKVWDITSEKLLSTLFGDFFPVTAVAYNPDGRTLAAGSSEDAMLRIWGIASESVLHAFSGHTDSVEAVSYSPDGRTLASASQDATVKIWDVASEKLLHTLSGHTDKVKAVSYSPDGGSLASGSEDKTVRIWNAASGELLHTLCGHTGRVRAVSYAPDGRTLVSGSWSDNTVRIWDVASGHLLHTLSPAEGVTVVSYSPDGRTFASGSGDGTVGIWGARAKEEETKHRKEEEQRRLREKLCVVCGQPLSFLDKLAGRTKCKRHREA